MSVYPFEPSPSLGVGEQKIAFSRNTFNESEIERVVAYFETLEKVKGNVGNAKATDDISRTRVSKVAWVKLNNESRWIYERLAAVTRRINGKHFRYDLYGFHDHMQYTVYEGEEKSHYDWHTDSGSTTTNDPPRKLSLVLQLNGPEEYEGGELEVMTTGRPVRVVREKGLIVVFPSYTVHRVRPVTSGVRRSLVVWVCGPAFR